MKKEDLLLVFDFLATALKQDVAEEKPLETLNKLINEPFIYKDPKDEFLNFVKLNNLEPKEVKEIIKSKTDDKVVKFKDEFKNGLGPDKKS